MDLEDRAHIVIPAEQWPRKYIYRFCPDCQEVFGLEKTAEPVCSVCGRAGCEDIFSEMAARLRHTWTFFEDARVEEGRWLFAVTPGGELGDPEDVYTNPEYALGYYAELRALGFVPPWLNQQDENMREKEDDILRKWLDELIRLGVNPEESFTVRNRVFMNEDKYPGPRTGEGFLKNLRRFGQPPVLETREKALAFFQNLPWKENPYAACNFIGKALHQHRWTRLAKGESPEDDIYYYVKQLIDSQFRPDKGCWGGQEAGHITRTNGNMKMLTTYVALDWEIPAPKKIIDFTLSGATEKAGFEGRHCSAFNQMFPLAAIRRKYPELSSYRGEEIDRYTAKSFATWLSNWDENLNFYGTTWLNKMNHGVVPFMAQILLDQPYQRGSVVYNWRETPIISRQPDGSIKINDVIYQRAGYPFEGGG